MNPFTTEQTTLLVSAAAEDNTATINQILSSSNRHQLLGNALVTAIAETNTGN